MSGRGSVATKGFIDTKDHKGEFTTEEINKYKTNASHAQVQFCNLEPVGRGVLMLEYIKV